MGLFAVWSVNAFIVCSVNFEVCLYLDRVSVVAYYCFQMRDRKLVYKMFKENGLFSSF